MTISRLSPTAALAVDVVALTVRRGRLMVLLGRRDRDPFAGSWALPGALVGPDEEPGDAAVRHLMAEAGPATAPQHLEQLATYASPGRDPRMRVVSVAHLALSRSSPDNRSTPDTRSSPDDRSSPEQGPGEPWAWHDAVAAGSLGLAFDHDRILADGLERLRAKLEYTPLAAALAPAEFTIADLRGVYEAAWGTTLDPRNFHRKITGEPGLLVPVGQVAAGGPGRPAQLYRRGPTRLLNPPITRATSTTMPGTADSTGPE